MAGDIFHGFSPNELRKEISRLVLDDARSLPAKAKVFAAVARLQNFDLLPETTDVEGLNSLVENGCVELNRGISGTKGVPASLYARDLLLGPMYPGTMSALGNGIYAATTGIYDDFPPVPPDFPTLSKVAMRYASKDESGVVLRCALKKNARVLDYDDLKSVARENRNRAKEAELTDFGALTAALGYDALFREDTFDDSIERVYVVVNRTALTFQREVLQLGHDTVN